jgi:hypothetical protein
VAVAGDDEIFLKIMVNEGADFQVFQKNFPMKTRRGFSRQGKNGELIPHLRRGPRMRAM